MSPLVLYTAVKVIPRIVTSEACLVNVNFEHFFQTSFSGQLILAHLSHAKLVPEYLENVSPGFHFTKLLFSRRYLRDILTSHYQILFSVHLLSLNVAIEAFDAHGLRGQNERMLDVADMVTILGSLYETISVSFQIEYGFLFILWWSPNASDNVLGDEVVARYLIDASLCHSLILSNPLSLLSWGRLAFIRCKYPSYTQRHKLCGINFTLISSSISVFSSETLS